MEKYSIVHRNHPKECACAPDTSTGCVREVFDVFAAASDEAAIKEYGRRSGTSWSELYRFVAGDRASTPQLDGSVVAADRYPIAYGTVSGPRAAHS